jgi:hypothetical protein
MAELGVFIGVLGGVMTSLILTFQKSKCEEIKCGCCAIKRKVTEEPVVPPTIPPIPPTDSTGRPLKKP